MSDVKIRWRWGRESERAKATAQINDEIFGVKWENFTLKWNSLTITLKSVFDWRSFSIDELCKKSHDMSIFRNWVNKKTFHWKEKNNFQVANRYLFPTPFPQSRAHSLSPHPLYNIRKKQKKEKNSIEIRNVPLHSTKTTTELESKEENSVSFFDEPNIIHILNPAPVLYLCFIAVLLSSCSFVVDYGIINLTVSFRCVWFFLRYMYTMLIIIVIFFALRSVCVCDFYCFKKWQEQCL